MATTGSPLDFPCTLCVLLQIICCTLSLCRRLPSGTQTDGLLYRTLDVPFPTARLASVALRSLQVDKELSPLVRRDLRIATPDTLPDTERIKDSVLKVTYKATTNRMLRVAVNGFMESLTLVLEVMETLDTDVLSSSNTNTL
ncbi:hypothetical protein PFICI_01822 [Pestalotiopsis fici W106-1]|uniref:Uncharacterized protein n=1 Tax=Pestalotiopsis fici (strain W106-1 / CGMCC3.15140) TaxID=1229662 RepID=W3XPT2_PESFW|nr:uncharacterized protein PFICI_01822 [Pestalotiopsis fici W106-1]ETS87994.1 hypothetical protein PFICI_01822 [Pestalotiopsis fici W106-1]